jgi:hypothetical protein
LDLLTIADDAERDRVGTQKAIGFVESDPARFPYLAVRRLGYFFGLERRALTYFYSNDFFGYIPFALLLTLALLILSPFGFVSCSAAFGLVLMRWDRSSLIVPLVMVAYLLPHVFLLADDRVHLTLVPPLVILAAIAWTSGRQALKDCWSRPVGRRAILLAALAVTLLLTNWGLELYRDAGLLAILFGPAGNISYFPY